MPRGELPRRGPRARDDGYEDHEYDEKEDGERRSGADRACVGGSFVEEDERRVSVVATRSDAFIERVENVTTGDHVRKGQPLLRLYSPEISTAAAQYLSAVGYDGARRRLENLAVPNEVHRRDRADP